MRTRSSRGGAEVRSPEEIQREAVRVLRSNLQVALAGLENPIVIVTSPNAGEGKTSTCVPLAQSLAQAGSRVVLVDLDLRHPDAHRLLDRPNSVGVVDVLRGNTVVEDALQYVPVTRETGMYFLSTGSSVSNPTELLGAGRTARLLGALAEQPVSRSMYSQASCNASPAPCWSSKRGRRRCPPSAEPRTR